MNLNQYREESQSAGQAYARIRKAVGYCGFVIPLSCLVLSLLADCPLFILPSISQYYYTGIGDLFVGALFAMGLFLMLYRSVFEEVRLRRQENRITNLAGLLAWVVAFFPTRPEVEECHFIAFKGQRYEDALGFWRHLHLPAAGLMIVLFGVISFVYFPRHWQSGRSDSLNKALYRRCALIIFVSMGVLVLYFADSVFLDGRYLRWTEDFRIVFVLECVAVWSFAVSWLQKGRALEALRDVWKGLAGKG